MSATSATFNVRLVPRGGADRVEGVEAGGVLLVRVAAAPVDGAANRSLLRLIADELGLPPSTVVLLAGARGRHKRILLRGAKPDAVMARWPGLELG